MVFVQLCVKENYLSSNVVYNLILWMLLVMMIFSVKKLEIKIKWDNLHRILTTI